MKKDIAILRITRGNILNLLNGLTGEQLNKVPEGFSNNIIWNAIHNLVTQQLLIYKLSGAEMRIPEHYVEAYRKGSKPADNVSDETIAEVKQLLNDTVDWLADDYANDFFPSYETYTTSYNISLESTEDAIRFNNVHEGLHLGYMMALRKKVIEG